MSILFRRITEHDQADRDRVALEDRTARDAEREPRTFRRQARLDLRRRHVFQAGVIDGANRALDAASTGDVAALPEAFRLGGKR